MTYDKGKCILVRLYMGKVVGGLEQFRKNKFFLIKTVFYFIGEIFKETP